LGKSSASSGKRVTMQNLSKKKVHLFSLILLLRSFMISWL
jgi:hypothetical protein